MGIRQLCCAWLYSIVAVIACYIVITVKKANRRTSRWVSMGEQRSYCSPIIGYISARGSHTLLLYNISPSCSMLVAYIAGKLAATSLWVLHVYIILSIVVCLCWQTKQNKKKMIENTAQLGTAVSCSLLRVCDDQDRERSRNAIRYISLRSRDGKTGRRQATIRKKRKEIKNNKMMMENGFMRRVSVVVIFGWKQIRELLIFNMYVYQQTSAVSFFDPFGSTYTHGEEFTSSA